MPAVQTDGNGYFVVPLIPATGSGTAYDTTVTSGSDSAAVCGVPVIVGSVQRADINLEP